MVYNPSRKSIKKFKKEIKGVNKLRVSCGLAEVRYGNIQCVGICGKEFYSFDKVNNRMCGDCNSKAKDSIPEESICGVVW